MADSTLALSRSFFILPRSESVNVLDRTDTGAWLLVVQVVATSFNVCVHAVSTTVANIELVHSLVLRTSVQ